MDRPCHGAGRRLRAAGADQPAGGSPHDDGAPKLVPVTTAGGDQKETDGPAAGTLYALKVDGVRGVPEFYSRIGL